MRATRGDPLPMLRKPRPQVIAEIVGAVDQATLDRAGGDVGPDLTGISKKFPRPYLLEALVDPDRQIAKGFDTVVLTLASGQQKSGILKSEDGTEVRLMNAEGQIITVPKADIDERSRGKSAMPDDLIQKMTRSELRDLVEFLAGL